MGLRDTASVKEVRRKQLLVERNQKVSLTERAGSVRKTKIWHAASVKEEENAPFVLHHHGPAPPPDIVLPLLIRGTNNMMLSCCVYETAQ